MPDPRPTLPPMDEIGSNGEFTCKIELIVVEQAHQRIFVDPATGATIATIAARPSVSAPATHSPRIEIERVLEFDIRRFGIKHSDVDLQAFRSLVELLGEGRTEGLRIVDLNGGSGEVALALCRKDSYDTVTIASHFTSDILLLLDDNLGDLLESRIQLSHADQLDLAAELQDEFDIVVVDSAADCDRLAALINCWIPLLAPGGVIAGTFQSNERFDVIKDIFDGINIQAFGASAWMVTKEDLDSAEALDGVTPGKAVESYE